MAHRVHLSRLSFAVKERRAHGVALRTADHVHRIPEVWSTHLVRDVLEWPDRVAVPDLVNYLTPVLCVVALRVDREGAVTFDGKAAISSRDQIFPAKVFRT